MLITYHSTCALTILQITAKSRALVIAQRSGSTRKPWIWIAVTMTTPSLKSLCNARHVTNNNRMTWRKTGMMEVRRSKLQVQRSPQRYVDPRL